MASGLVIYWKWSALFAAVVMAEQPAKRLAKLVSYSQESKFAVLDVLLRYLAEKLLTALKFNEKISFCIWHDLCFVANEWLTARAISRED